MQIRYWLIDRLATVGNRFCCFIGMLAKQEIGIAFQLSLF